MELRVLPTDCHKEFADHHFTDALNKRHRSRLVPQRKVRKFPATENLPPSYLRSCCLVIGAVCRSLREVLPGQGVVARKKLLPCGVLPLQSLTLQPEKPCVAVAEVRRGELCGVLNCCVSLTLGAIVPKSSCRVIVKKERRGTLLPPRRTILPLSHHRPSPKPCLFVKCYQQGAAKAFAAVEEEDAARHFTRERQVLQHSHCCSELSPRTWLESCLALESSHRRKTIAAHARDVEDEEESGSKWV